MGQYSYHAYVPPGEYEQGNLFGASCIFFIWYAFALDNPHLPTLVMYSARLAMPIALAIVIWKFHLATKTISDTTFSRELVASFYRSRLLVDIIMWPLTLVGLFRGLKEDISYLYVYQEECWRERRKSAPGAYPETINEMARADMENLASSVDRATEMAEPVVRVAAATAMSATIAASAGAQTKEKPVSSPTTVQVQAWTDKDWERQLWLNISHGDLMVVSQERISADGKSAFQHIGIGRKFRFGPFTGATTVGPLYDFRSAKISQIVFLIGGTFKHGDLKIFSANRFAFGTLQEFMLEKHVQTVNIPGLPGWLAVNTEQLHNPLREQSWDEIFIGPLVTKNGGSWTVSGYPYWDFAHKRFDIRLSATKTLKIQ